MIKPLALITLILTSSVGVAYELSELMFTNHCNYWVLILSVLGFIGSCVWVYHFNNSNSK